MEKLYKADKMTAEEIMKDFKEEEKLEAQSRWINVGTLNKDSSKEEIDNLLREAVVKAREIAKEK